MVIDLNTLQERARKTVDAYIEKTRIAYEDFATEIDAIGKDFGEPDCSQAEAYTGILAGEMQRMNDRINAIGEGSD